MTDLILERNLYRADGIFGQLKSYDGKHLLYTLERAYKQEDGQSEVYLPKVLKGKYECVRGEHKLADLVPFETFEIMKVPGHFDILFHVGNYNEDSEGCILVGKSMGLKIGGKQKMLTYSKQGFKEFMDYMKEKDTFWLTVI